MCLLDERVLVSKIGCAGRRCNDRRGECRHEGCTGGEVGGACRVEGLRDADEGFRVLKEGVGVLLIVRSN